MNLPSILLFPRSKNKIPRQVISGTWSDREAILKSGTNLFCWQRPVNEQIHQCLQELSRKPLENIKAHVGLSDLANDLNKARVTWDWTFSTNHDVFWDDVRFLVKNFLNMSANGAGTLHLRLVNNDACTKFHVDGYNLRLFTTYFGPGTEWLPEKVVNRTALGKSNHQIVKDPKLIRQMKAFEVGILKGEIPNRPKSTPGIVHRSPPILGTVQKRIIMRLDI